MGFVLGKYSTLPPRPHWHLHFSKVSVAAVWIANQSRLLSLIIHFVISHVENAVQEIEEKWIKYTFIPN